MKCLQIHAVWNNVGISPSSSFIASLITIISSKNLAQYLLNLPYFSHEVGSPQREDDRATGLTDRERSSESIVGVDEVVVV